MEKSGPMDGQAGGRSRQAPQSTPPRWALSRAELSNEAFSSRRLFASNRRL